MIRQLQGRQEPMPWKAMSMESNVLAAPNKSHKQRELSQIVQGLHHTTKAQLLHAAINWANIDIMPGGDGGSLFYGLIW